MRTMMLLFAVAFAAVIVCSTAAGAIETKVLLEADRTIVGEPVIYPNGDAKVTTVIATFAPGEATGWHRHGIPVVGYVLEGELTVDYGSQGKHVYRAGDAVMEAIQAPHDGTNTGAGPMRILVVYMGAAGRPNSELATAPK
jgi:quercetin dioxygenase-like cupin family protein